MHSTVSILPTVNGHVGFYEINTPKYVDIYQFYHYFKKGINIFRKFKKYVLYLVRINLLRSWINTIVYEWHHTCVIMAVDHNQILENTQT